MAKLRGSFIAKNQRRRARQAAKKSTANVKLSKQNKAINTLAYGLLIKSIVGFKWSNTNNVSKTNTKTIQAWASTFTRRVVNSLPPPQRK